jgi:hypothetical protein
LAALPGNEKERGNMVFAVLVNGVILALFSHLIDASEAARGMHGEALVQAFWIPTGSGGVQ